MHNLLTKISNINIPKSILFDDKITVSARNGLRFCRGFLDVTMLSILPCRDKLPGRDLVRCRSLARFKLSCRVSSLGGASPLPGLTTLGILGVAILSTLPRRLWRDVSPIRWLTNDSMEPKLARRTNVPFGAALSSFTDPGREPDIGRLPCPTADLILSGLTESEFRSLLCDLSLDCVLRLTSEFALTIPLVNPSLVLKLDSSLDVSLCILACWSSFFTSICFMCCIVRITPDFPNID